MLKPLTCVFIIIDLIIFVLKLNQMDNLKNALIPLIPEDHVDPVNLFFCIHEQYMVKGRVYKIPWKAIDALYYD